MKYSPTALLPFIAVVFAAVVVNADHLGYCEHEVHDLNLCYQKEALFEYYGNNTHLEHYDHSDNDPDHNHATDHRLARKLLIDSVVFNRCLKCQRYSTADTTCRDLKYDHNVCNVFDCVAEYCGACAELARAANKCRLVTQMGCVEGTEGVADSAFCDNWWHLPDHADEGARALRAKRFLEEQE